jgi:hypothetical protein
MTRRTTKHVFLFRHCVRSVGEDIKFDDGTSSSSNSTTYSTDPFDYLPHWPAWNTPAEWCTSAGAHIVKGTGAFLLNRYLINDDGTDDDNNNNNNNGNTGFGNGEQRKYRVAFISDKTPRDMQTALAMMTGMAETIMPPRTTNPQLHKTTALDHHPLVVGLDTVEIDPMLFHPFERNGFRSKATLQKEVCATPPSEDTKHAIKHRLSTIPPPSSLWDIVQWMTKQTGIDLFHVFDKEDLTNITLGPDGEQFQGAWNLVQYVAQSVAYSRASGILEDNYWANVTTDEFYQLLAWIHWSRSVQNVGNNLAAANGGVLMARILRALRLDQQDSDATFIIGHDSDLDAVATAIGISWSMPPPYHPKFNPTPPGSGIHFAYDGNGIEISFMAPTFFSDKRASHLNSSGILVEVPVTLDKQGYQAQNKGDDTTVVFPSLNALRDHILLVLRNYNGSIECYEAAEKIYSQSSYLMPLPMNSVNGAGSIILVVGALLGFAIAIAFVSYRHCLQHRRIRRHKARHGTEQYMGMPSTYDLELT